MLEIIIELNLQGRRAVTSHWSAESMRTLRSSAWTPFTPPSPLLNFHIRPSLLRSRLLLQNSWRVTNRVARIDSPLRFPRISARSFVEISALGRNSSFDARLGEHSGIRKWSGIWISLYTIFFTRFVDNFR